MRTWVLCILMAGCASSPSPPPVMDAPGSTPSLAHDIAQEAPDLVAAFDDRGQIRKWYPQAEQVGRYGEVTIWRIAGGKVKWSRLETIGRYSPVFGAGPHQWRALPGGVVVRLSPHIDAQSASDWFRARGLSATPLASSMHTYLVSTPAGVGALAVAERLSRLPEVLDASPNWWQPHSTRD